MVTVAWPGRTIGGRTLGNRGWTVAAAFVLVFGASARLQLGGGRVGDQSAAVMAALLTLGAYAAARLLGGPRVAFVTSLALIGLFNLAALPPRNPPEYDDLEAFYRTDQVLSAQLPVPGTASMVVLLVEPRFQGVQPAFGLAGSINGIAVEWSCPFKRGIQRLALPLPAGVLENAAKADIQLHLTGSPSREGDYLVVNASSRRGGFLISLEPPTSGRNTTTTTCARA